MADKFFFLLGHFASSTIGFEDGSESERLDFPLGEVLLFFLVDFLFLLKFFFDDFSLFHEFFLLLGDDSLLLNVEFGSFVLEYFFADFFVFADTVRVKLSSTALSAHDKSGRIVFLDLLLGIV